ncbi:MULTISPECIES: UDP-N-acetylmuramoylalanyl-D-glutamyl-2,6-diaminopimelate--D-alanyl-D-alanine ligase [unclassified Chelatococcus]|uniref:UDP-N-acetylmuramoylalanyl-D-glutamyl-2, 6-diaminopimelate--D-alanyl-D-alanine ligase n=2 Tax=Chelatococcus TaxID=28209 RepID=UPI0020C0EE71|nr:MULTISPECIES: UDP-N-acetylmuramoylalanyl-D-glutamyl-2,6-diaminopimelate--D-alanyl-D-alanine ligase [unclassified Chelatococcus]MCO5079306.1 UDP-N-acetylmuramoylalanyl-D-glutamyl-2,6-diaminopimelate--D-alanyl-D-alanine ligase [Chelatococcus sp.]CAH1666407.1 UDP-N-acetylmuramoyl-tripeptide--D-alanyl-D-alanine ligase [Hyphomicrobiales bacterium]CAH1680608.1 UDP-N-acetylmuramoyl-tripeptide--D-alanyl-D-alanine ligase [Hyphomicrobiales bacterium]
MSATMTSSKSLWTGAELAEAMGARLEGEAAGAITGVSIDTRTLAPGDAYFSIRGDVHDGHAFVAEAFRRDAAAAVVDEAHVGELAGAGPMIVVPDVLRGLESAARASRARSPARFVAVTGSVGKTSTKEALRLALGSQGEVHASAASYNNHWGVPLSLARMPAHCDFGVFEIGMSAPGEIVPLTHMVRPHVAVVTTVAPVHLEFFPSIAAIADAKGEVFLGLEPGGVAVINRDIGEYGRLKSHAMASPAGRIITFGEHDEADVRARRIIPQADCTVVDATVFGVPVAYRIGSPGRHIALNSLAVLAAVKALGGDLALAALALSELAPPVGRGERTRLTVAGGEVLLIDESYNANPASMRAAIEALGQSDIGFRGRRIAVLADMLELGSESERLHEALVATLEENAVDVVFAAGPAMKSLWRHLPMNLRGSYAPAPAELEATVTAALRAGDVVMIKGSNGTRISRLVTALKGRFADTAPATVKA